MTHSYFVVMVDFGRRGLQAVVSPEETRRDIISNIARGEYRGEIAFIHAISGSCVEDVTAEITAEAHALMLQAAE